MPDDRVWEDIRHAYLTAPLSIPELLAEFGITEGQLRRRREAEGWSPRNGLALMRAAARRDSPAPSKAAPAKRTKSSAGKSAKKPASKPSSLTELPDKPGSKAKPKRSASPATAAGRKALIKRLSDIIDKKLSTLERRMAHESETVAGSDDASGAEIDRDIRAIGQLIKNLEQAMAHDPSASAKSGDGGTRKRGRDVSAAELADAADRHRQELLDRLQRLVDTAAQTAADDPRRAEAE